MEKPRQKEELGCFKQDKMNGVSRERKTPSGTEDRVARESWTREAQGPKQGRVPAADRRVARPVSLSQDSLRPFRMVLCLLCGAFMLGMVRE